MDNWFVYLLGGFLLGRCLHVGGDQNNWTETLSKWLTQFGYKRAPVRFVCGMNVIRPKSDPTTGSIVLFVDSTSFLHQLLRIMLPFSLLCIILSDTLYSRSYLEVCQFAMLGGTNVKKNIYKAHD